MIPLLRPFLVLATTVSCGAFAQAKPPVIVIDPGHGGAAVAGSLDQRSNSSPNNATTPGGLKEKDLTLEFSRILEEEIHREASRQGRKVGVLLTRQTDVNLDFIERAKLCNRPDTACVVSIHFNAGGGASASGSLTVIAAKDRNPDYETDRAFAAGLASACSQGVRKYLPQSKDKGVIHDSHLHGGRGSNFFFQLQRQPHLKGKPKCFLEVEFIDNPKVEKALLTDNRGEKFREVAASIAAYLVAATEEGARKKG
ncbi:MAG TPA: N-acetylmuramoyl-L-alanine amidase [Bacteroidia bacterium]|nr:N-acetylmuramoyl-L-alanine amidase [Bacteroidia bacterium]